MGLVLALVAVLPASSGHAANCFWQGGTGTYNNATSWRCGAVPGTSDNAFNNTGTNNRVQINVGDPDWQVIDFLTGTGVGTSGAFEQNGQTARTTGWFRMGVETGSLGIYTLNGGTLNVFPGRLNLGEKGTGVLHLNGGVIYKSGDVIILEMAPGAARAPASSTRAAACSTPPANCGSVRSRAAWVNTT